MTVQMLLSLAGNLLQKIGIESYDLDAKIILQYVLSWDRLTLELNKQQNIDLKNCKIFLSLLAKRLKFEPIAYILGKKEFYGLEFLVKDCLIPRPDTECIVEYCLAHLANRKDALVVDLCTGSGCIGLSIAYFTKNTQVILSDISNLSLITAQNNAKKLCLENKTKFFLGDLFEPLKDIKADLIVVNPPYISNKEMFDLSKDIYDYEPHKALCSYDELGIFFYEKIIKESYKYLKNDGILVMEIGYNQKDLIKNIAKSYFNNINFFQDLAGNTRGVVLK